MNKYLYTLLAFIIVLGNVACDHFYAPTGILISPAITAMSSILVVFHKQTWSVLLQTVFVFMLVSINDIGIKLYGGGIHDHEGQGFITLFSFGSFIICFLILFFYNLQKEKVLLVYKISSVGLFILLSILHWHFFGWLGLGRSFLV